ncbi:hypothetical protein C7U92_15070 [Bradyrhizobium sp. WBOS7]|uniref:SPOR domain-containing protein n=1 Tax=Bradyrhizobium betae TaxID=244734 RepID=A0AAE9ND98_9BRAD|nr:MULTISPECIES: hypothetical protein [Bradyrhizobium]MDD1571720.1 hypothetical protein [Bradyrhizobium sp. WBOS1]UUO37212.1 hypothetical protein DCK84_23305 [Bradyrhizobium sp. WBOS01]MDD1528873.1 hypothetical protein [Bradyrhizobium sp. WBOS2]MDD1578042.1 hypothetical protein [Bradyrhizobium sp. WBOS7]MDD1600081.1 hypothetical protein [Bradyrhizobium sp. WBOS16]
MAKDSDPLADAFGAKETGGLFSGLLAEESAFDRRLMWRLGSWGVGAVGAVTIAVLANQAQLGWRRDQVASADLARQADRLQMLTRESQNEARRLTAAIETLNTDRDRLYSRVTVLEQGLDSVTGAIARQTTAPPPVAKAQDAAPAAPSVAPVASTPASAPDKPRTEAAKDTSKDTVKDTAKEAAKEPPPQTAAAASLVQQSPAMNSTLPTIPLVPSKSIMAPPDPAASKLTQPETNEKAAEKKAEPAPAPTEIVAAAAKPSEATESESPAIAVQQTRFAIDLGGANSVDGLRALWRGVTKSNPEIAALRPIIMIKEGTTGLGMQLRLGAGPLVNAAVAAKFCASLAESNRHCETTVFDGQRLSMRGTDKAQEKPQEKPQDKVQEKSQDRVQDKNAEKSQDAAPQAETAPGAKPEKPQRRRGYTSKRSKREEPAPAPAAPPAPAKPEAASATSTLSSFFRR